MKALCQILLLSFAATSLLLADTFTLQDGTVVDGDVDLETDEHFVVKWRGEDGIARQKKFLKTEVVKREKAQPGDDVYKELKKLENIPDLLTTEEYKDRAGRGKAFLLSFPKSRHAPAVKQLIKIHEDHLKLALSGARRLDERWISAADWARNAYELDARVLIDAFEASSKTDPPQDSLRKFVPIEKEYTKSEHFPRARQAAMQVLAAYKLIVQDQLARVPAMLKEREVQLSRVRIGQREAAKKQAQQDDASYLKLIATQKAAGMSWLPLNQYHAGPMKDVLRNIDAAVQRLTPSGTEKPKVVGPIYRKATAAGAEGEWEEGATLLAELQGLNVPQRYLDAVKAAVTAPEEVAPDPTPPTPDPSEPAPTPAPSDPTPDKADPSSPKTTTSPEPAPDENADPNAPAATKEKAEKKGLPMQLILIGVMVVVIAGALLAAFGGKKK